MIRLPGEVNLSTQGNSYNCCNTPTISDNSRVFPSGEDNASTIFQRTFFPKQVQEQDQRARDTLARYLERKTNHDTAQMLLSDLTENKGPLLVKDVNRLRTEAEQIKLAKLIKNFKSSKKKVSSKKTTPTFIIKSYPPQFVLKNLIKRHRFNPIRISSKLERTTNASAIQIKEITTEITNALSATDANEVDCKVIQNLLIKQIVLKNISLKQPKHSISFETIYPPFRT